MFQLIQYYLLTFLLIPALILSGLWISFRFRWLHIRSLPLAIKLLFTTSDKKSKKNISSFAAFSAILGGNLGVGNISGTAIALATGGPGSILWMGIIILIAAVLKYVSCHLGVDFRDIVKNRHVGGPMYFMKNALNAKFLAIVFALATMFGSLTIGNLIQVNSLSLPMEHIGIPGIYAGIFIAIIMWIVIIGGAKAFSNVVSAVVPFMAITYVSLCIYILFLNKMEVIPAINLIFNEGIFNSSHIKGGVTGYIFAQAFVIVQVGVSRAILATDIGLGLEAILHSSVKQKDGHVLPLDVEQGLISVISPFIVLIVCFLTALVLITTGVWNIGLESTNMCFVAFSDSIGSKWAGYFLILVLFCFSFTTILTWSFCGDRALEYLTNYDKKILKIWQIFFVLIIPIGSVLKVSLAWALADFAVSIMLLTNLIAIIPLSNRVVSNSREALLQYKE